MMTRGGGSVEVLQLYRWGLQECVCRYEHLYELIIVQIQEKPEEIQVTIWKLQFFLDEKNVLGTRYSEV